MKISVVIPAYNAEKYLEETLRSIEEQTVSPSEIILVDDASRDRTNEIAQNYGAKIIQHSVNTGIGLARQHGANEAKGDYVAFLSADDVYHPKFLETVLKHADLERAVFTDYYRCNPQLQPFTVFKAPIYETQKQFMDLVAEWALQKNMFVNFSTVLIPKYAFRKARFEEELRHGEDLIFLLDTVLEDVPWIHVSEPLVYYRIHGKMGSRRGDPAEWSLLWKHLANRLKGLGVNDEAIIRAMEESRGRCFPSIVTRIENKFARMYAHVLPLAP